MEPGWDQKATKDLVDLGLSWEHARIAVGLIAEHRQTADNLGFNRGFEAGYEAAIRKITLIDTH